MYWQIYIFEGKIVTLSTYGDNLQQEEHSCKTLYICHYLWQVEDLP